MGFRQKAPSLIGEYGSRFESGGSSTSEDSSSEMAGRFAVCDDHVAVVEAASLCIPYVMVPGFFFFLLMLIANSRSALAGKKDVGKQLWMRQRKDGSRRV